MINQLQYFFGVKGQVALDWNPGPGYITLLLRLIPRDLYSVCPHRLFLTLPGLSDSQAALLNPNACVLRREGICTIFVMVFIMTYPGRDPTTGLDHIIAWQIKMGNITCNHTCKHTFAFTKPAILSISPRNDEIRDDLPLPTDPTIATNSPHGIVIFILKIEFKKDSTLGKIT